MMLKEHNYYYNPYLPLDREGKGEMMSLIRAMLLLCTTILLSVAAFIFSNYTKDRFEIVSLKDGVFIFDRQSTASNFCNDSKCIVLSSEFLIPKKVLVSEIPGVTVKTQLQVQNPTAQVTTNPAPQNPAPQLNSTSPMQNTVSPTFSQPNFSQSNLPTQNTNPSRNFNSLPQNNTNFDNQNLQQDNNSQNDGNDQNQDSFQN